MPTYEYRCPEGHTFELFQKISEKPRAKCPTCGKMASRQISGGAGLVFKGSGFYITDYGKDGKGPRKDSASSTSDSSASASSAETKPAPAETPAEKPKGKSPSKKAKE
ncbi:MAG TPA: zinc ribbon domain-containing protein [Gemmatimonadales bacterium]|nr:zinc ribbon domain-containing protein [Gemmatimonadales bacterium]